MRRCPSSYRCSAISRPASTLLLRSTAPPLKLSSGVMSAIASLTLRAASTSGFSRLPGLADPRLDGGRVVGAAQHQGTDQQRDVLGSELFFDAAQNLGDPFVLAV